MKKEMHPLLNPPPFQGGGRVGVKSPSRHLKFKIYNLKFERRSLSGATLVMSLLILSLLVGAGIGFSVLIFGQIQAARSFDNAVVAEITAQSRAEEVMYYLRKESSVVTLGNTCPPYTGEPAYSNGATTDCSLIGQSSNTVNLAENDSAQFDLFSNDQLNAPAIHGININFSVQSISPEPKMEITVWALRNESNNFVIETGQGIRNDLVGRRLIQGSDAGQTITFRFNNDSFACENAAATFCIFKTLEGNNKQINNNFIQTNIVGYRVKIKSLYNSFNNVTVTPLDLDGNTSVNLYFPSPLKIRVTGNFRGSKFTEEVTAATRPSLSGLFDYALFSPSDITK